MAAVSYLRIPPAYTTEDTPASMLERVKAALVEDFPVIDAMQDHIGSLRTRSEVMMLTAMKSRRTGLDITSFAKQFFEATEGKLPTIEALMGELNTISEVVQEIIEVTKSVFLSAATTEEDTAFITGIVEELNTQLAVLQMYITTYFPQVRDAKQSYETAFSITTKILAPDEAAGGGGGGGGGIIAPATFTVES